MKKIFAILFVAILCCGFIPSHADARKQSSRKSVSELYAEAIKALTIYRDTTSAVKALVDIIDQDTSQAPAMFYLSRIIKNPANATMLAERAYQSDTNNLFYLRAYITTLLETNRRDDIIIALKKLVKTSTDLEDFYRLALLLAAQEDFDGSLAVLDSADMRFGRVQEFRTMRYWCLLSQNRILEAEADAKKGIEEAPYLAESHINLGKIYASTNRDSLAIVSYQNAIAVDTLNPQPWLHLANFYAKREDMSSFLSIQLHLCSNNILPLEEKIDLWKTLTKDRENYRKFYFLYDSLIKNIYIQHPDNVEVVRLYIAHNISSGDKEEALRLCKLLANGPLAEEEDFNIICYLEESLNRPDSVNHYVELGAKRFPRSIKLCMGAGYVAEAHEDFNTALKYYERALGIAEDNKTLGNIYADIGRIEFHRGDMKACYKAFDNALKHHKDNDTLRSSIYCSIGDIEYQRKDTKQSYKAYEKSLRCFADNVLTLNNYAYHLSLGGKNLERALKMIDRALELSDKNATYLDTKAWILYKMGRYAEAKTTMQQALSLYGGKDPIYALHYGDILHALGEEFMAKTYWRKALEQGADKEEIEKRFLPQEDNSKK